MKEKKRKRKKKKEISSLVKDPSYSSDWLLGKSG
jgi:hypothetical protein